MITIYPVITAGGKFVSVFQFNNGMFVFPPLSGERTSEPREGTTSDRWIQRPVEFIQPHVVVSKIKIIIFAAVHWVVIPVGIRIFLTISSRISAVISKTHIRHKEIYRSYQRCRHYNIHSLYYCHSCLLLVEQMRRGIKISHSIVASLLVG